MFTKLALNRNQRRRIEQQKQSFDNLDFEMGIGGEANPVMTPIEGEVESTLFPPKQGGGLFEKLFKLKGKKFKRFTGRNLKHQLLTYYRHKIIKCSRFRFK